MVVTVSVRLSGISGLTVAQIIGGIDPDARIQIYDC